MWSPLNRKRWPELDALQEPTDIGRRLDVGGFVLNDPFDTFLRQVSETYLQSAWQRLDNILTRYQFTSTDLSWGAPHPGETYIADRTPDSPSDFIGWTSRQLAQFNTDPRYEAMDTELRTGSPVIRCVVTWRSHKWAIAPDNFRLALQLIEALCTDELSSWDPNLVLYEKSSPTEPWLSIAHAIREHDQQQLEQAIATAKMLYSPIGYRIVIRAYSAFLEGIEK